jgi:hypothetical protein
LLSLNGDLVTRKSEPESIADAIRGNYRFLLVLSKYSHQNDWLSAVISEVVQEEKKRKRQLIFLVLLDSKASIVNSAELSSILEEPKRISFPFDHWTDKDGYNQSLNSLSQVFEG